MQQHQKTVWYTAINSPIGEIYLAALDHGLARVIIGNKSDKPLVIEELRVLYPTCSISESPVPFRKVINWLNDYFAGKNPDKTKARAASTNSGIKFDFSTGTAFQQSVWKTLCRIPYGQVRSYQWIAEQIRNPKSVRAVGQANGKNPIPILVPCHRVINKNGSLGGYSGGITVKRKLLGLEGVVINPKSQIQMSNQLC